MKQPIEKEILKEELYKQYCQGIYSEQNKDRIDFVLNLRQEQLNNQNALELYVLNRLSKSFDNIQYQVPIPIIKDGGKLDHIYLADMVINNTHIVEIDGKMHELQKDYDNNRDKLTKEAGFTTHRLTKFDFKTINNLVKTISPSTKEQFVVFPSIDLKEYGLKPKDMLVYADIRKYLNNKSGYAKPSISRIQDDLNISRVSVIASISKLKQAGLLQVDNTSSQVNHYKFSEVNKFEKIPLRLIESQKLTNKEKEYIICTYRYMINLETIGICKLSHLELSDKINMSRQSICKIEKSLSNMKNPILTITSGRDIDGSVITERIYHFDNYV